MRGARARSARVYAASCVRTCRPPQSDRKFCEGANGGGRKLQSAPLLLELSFVHSVSPFSGLVQR